MNACIHTYTRTYIHTYIHTHIYIYTYIHDAYMHTHLHPRTHRQTRGHTHTHTQTHTRACARAHAHGLKSLTAGTCSESCGRAMLLQQLAGTAPRVSTPSKYATDISLSLRDGEPYVAPLAEHRLVLGSIDGTWSRARCNTQELVLFPGDRSKERSAAPNPAHAEDP